MPLRFFHELLDVLSGSFQDEIHCGQSCQLCCGVGELPDQRYSESTLKCKYNFVSCRAMVAAPEDCAVTYIEALSEESLVADWRERNHHDHGEQAREGHDLRGLENGGNIWLGLVDLTINLYELFTYIKKVQGRTCQQQLESKCITCLFKQLDAVLPSTFEPGRVRVLSLLKVPCQNVRAGLEHISDQLSHQLVLGGLFQPHQELQQHDVASSVGKWVSVVGDQHGKPRIRLQIKRAGRSLTCQLCQSWHHEN